MKDAILFVLGVAAFLMLWEVRASIAALVEIAIQAWREARSE